MTKDRVKLSDVEIRNPRETLIDVLLFFVAGFLWLLAGAWLSVGPLDLDLCLGFIISTALLLPFYYLQKTIRGMIR